MNWFGQHQVGAEAEGFGDARLSLDHRNRQRRLVGSRVSRALEQQRRILLIVAVHHDGVEVLGHQFFHRGKGLVARLDSKLEFAQYLADDASRFLVRAEQ